METDSKTILQDIAQLRNHTNVLDKINISQTYQNLGNSVKSSIYFDKCISNVSLGDDTAAILQEDGSYLLFAAEGIIEDFLISDPWFAGYSAVMVNISDICAMGGLPIAVTDTLYAKNEKNTKEIWEGMLTASKNYGVPIVGGHTCYHTNSKALSVSIIGRATKHILTSFNAVPGEELLLAIDQKGMYYKNYPFWNASTNTAPETLQEQVKLPYIIANQELSTVAKDISMGGILGTIHMLMNTSKIGVEINLKKITKPADISWNKWLISFPSYGYLFSCKTHNISHIKAIFSKYKIQCDHIGHITAERKLLINHNDEKLKF
ncbi:sll0787 family AIR synthase-like protein [Aquimarina sp. RZ0]|uniref:sll0787 family AIR synthase-like protein n=1 Tax=Aquimarina sp. RZ0 TaxID=2607730 RepID=UPI0011F24FF5|nr:sll0787 family AIR synthase-like protein [Aquimarina sp. RZ0]KAA1243130.1 sll0787 family AIR synthase-like protein [Aquimarina sp. RZ0]